MTDPIADAPSPSLPAEGAPRPTFDELYDQHFKFVWRSLRRLGVREALLDDASQDAFIVVHRRLADYEPRVSVRAWLYAIARRVAHDYRRTESRKGGGLPLNDSQPSLRPGPYEDAVKSQAAGIVLQFLDTLPDAQRECFILSDLEQFSAPEVASVVGANISTVYSRVQAARAALERFVSQRHPDAVKRRGARG
jgi:RNA polymerase sigma-70 factor (ECF subfamily)